MTVPRDDLVGEWLSRLLRPAASSTAASEPLEQVVLGGPRRYTRIEVEARSGVSRDRNAQLWRALGFADVDDDEVVFTDADIEAVTLIDGLVGSGLIDPDVEAAVARAAGQSLSRLAEWEIALLDDYVTGPGTGGVEQPDETTVMHFATTILPVLEHLHAYVWRRHIVALAGRALAGPPDETATNRLVVGFADVVGYTRLTRDLTEAELAQLIDRFESTAADTVATAGGRVVKALGDAIMFTAVDPTAAAAIALGLLDAIAVDDALPDVRIGMARGPVLRRFGDVYGPVVNIASRLTSAAKRGTILVDQELAAALADEPELRLRRRRPMAVRGYSNLSSWRLLGAPPTSADDPAR